MNDSSAGRISAHQPSRYGTWERPDAFPAGVYETLIWPDMFFIPLYVAAAALLWRRHWLGSVLAFVASGGIIYVMVYLLALSGLSGSINLVADGLFLGCTLVSLWQVGARADHASEGCPPRDATR